MPEVNLEKERMFVDDAVRMAKIKGKDSLELYACNHFDRLKTLFEQARDKNKEAVELLDRLPGVVREYHPSLNYLNTENK